MAPNAQNVALPHLQIVDKLTEFPLVHSALDYANARYAALKGSSQLVNATLDRAEKSIQLVVTTGVVPVLNKLEQPIHYADNIAVHGLDLAVAKIGSIQKSSGELKDSTRKVVDQTKERLSAARASAVQTVQAKVHSVLTLPGNVVPLLDQILNAGENVLDYLMPEKDGSGASKPATNGTSAKPAKDEATDARTVIRVVFVRVRAFSDKVQKRVVDYTRDRWIPALFASALVIQRNVVGLVANGTAAKLLANGHSTSPAPAAEESNSVAKEESPKKSAAPTNSTPKKSAPLSPIASPASSNSSPASSANGDVKKQSADADQSYDSVTSS